MKKKSHSMVRQVVLIPMTVMLFILLITIGVSGFTVINMQHQMVDSYESAAKVTLNRVDVRLTQIETAFVDYWIYDTNHANLRALSFDTPKEEYLKFQTGTVSWMKRTADIFSEIEGLVVYYRNLDLLQFQGKANSAMHRFMTEFLRDAASRYNRWQIVELNGQGYLFIVKKHVDFCGGAWIPVDMMVDSLGLDSSYPGFGYFRDEAGHTVISASKAGSELCPDDQDLEIIRIDDEYYYQRKVTTEKKDISMGVLIFQQKILECGSRASVKLRRFRTISPKLSQRSPI